MRSFSKCQRSWAPPHAPLEQHPQLRCICQHPAVDQWNNSKGEWGQMLLLFPHWPDFTWFCPHVCVLCCAIVSMDALYHTVYSGQVGAHWHLPPPLYGHPEDYHCRAPAWPSQVPHRNVRDVAEESRPSPHLACHYWGCGVSGGGAAWERTQRQVLSEGIVAIEPVVEIKF